MSWRQTLNLAERRSGIVAICADKEKISNRLFIQLDRHAVDSPPVRANYHRAMELEYGFFDANCPSS